MNDIASLQIQCVEEEPKQVTHLLLTAGNAKQPWVKLESVKRSCELDMC